MKLNKICDLLKNNDDFLIITHKKPDGDTTGSASALCKILRKLNKKAYILKNEDITPKYEYLIKPFYADNDFKPKFIITTDVASLELLDKNAQKYKGNIDLCIDHHYLSNNGYAKYNLIEDYAACGELIFNILEQIDVKLDEEIAHSLYVSISTDTGCFKFSNTTSHTHKVAKECLKFIDAGELNRVLFEIKTKEYLEIFKILLNKINILDNGCLAIMPILLVDKKKTGATPDDLDNISAFPRSIEGVEVAITLNEQENGNIKASVRSNGKISSSDICKIYGGGGHLRASGVTFESKSIEECTNLMIKAYEKVKSNV